MNAPARINELSHEEIRAWLDRALHGKEPLLRLTPDESAYLGILRVEREAKPPARDSLRDGCLQLVRQFCIAGSRDVPYAEELLSLVTAFKSPETVEMLAKLAVRFPELPTIPAEIRFAVLAALVDTPPPRDMAFWEMILAQDSEKHAGLVLSGVLATNPEQAVAMLPRFPNSERLGQAAALKLDLTWDALPVKKRFQFMADIRAVLPSCRPCFADPVRTWLDSKEPSTDMTSNPTLQAALSEYLGEGAAPKFRSSKLFAKATLLAMAS